MNMMVLIIVLSQHIHNLNVVSQKTSSILSFETNMIGSVAKPP